MFLPSSLPVSDSRLGDNPSRSYLGKQIPIVTTYDDVDEEQTERASIAPSAAAKRKSVAGSTKAPTVTKAGSVRNEELRPASRAATNRPESVRPQSRAANRPESVIRSPSLKAGTIPAEERAPTVRSPSRTGSRAPSRAGSYAEGAVAGGMAGVGVGDVISHERQHQLQQQGSQRNSYQAGHSLQDNGPAPHFDDHPRSTSPRPHSSFGHRPLPNLMSVTEDSREGQYGGRQSRSAGMLDRSGTVVSRANTLGRNGTLSRTQNGGIVGSRRGAFGRGAGTSVGTQPEEVLGRDDIHARAELSERILDDATLRRLSTMEKKDAKRLAKVIKAEGNSEAKAVKGSIKELERIVKLQREAASAERKSQLRLSKWTSKEHKARLRFLKEKERYERIEGELRNAENDYEERRDHAAGLTSQVAEKTQDLDDLRAQKAADDVSRVWLWLINADLQREREVKLLALKNPAHS